MMKDENELYFLVDGGMADDFENVPLLKLNKSNKALLDWLIESGYFVDGTRLIAFADFEVEEF
jgi:hypothetical protein